MSRYLAVFVCVSLYSLAHAGDIYRWVDENGRTNFGDSVPEKYRKSATKVDVRPLEPPVAQPRPLPQRAPSTITSTTAPERSTAAGQSANATALDCEAEHRRYRESVDCFAKYMTTRGFPRAEAFDHCQVVRDPSIRCGPPRAESSERTYVDPASSERTYSRP